MLKKSIPINNLENTVGGTLYVFTERDGRYIELDNNAVIISNEDYQRLYNYGYTPSQIAAHFIQRAIAHGGATNYPNLPAFIALRAINANINHRIIDEDGNYVL